MNDKHIYILLEVIKSNGDIRRLKREGVDYIQIAELTKISIENGWVTYDNDKIHLSEKGEEHLEKLELKNKIRNKEEWIDKEKESRIPKLSKDFIFLPNQNEINF